MSEWICPQTQEACPAGNLCQIESQSAQRVADRVREEAAESQQAYLETGQLKFRETTLVSEGVMRVNANGESVWLSNEEAKKERQQESISPTGAADLSELKLRDTIMKRLPFPKTSEEDSQLYDSYDPNKGLVCLRGDRCSRRYSL